MKPYRFALGIGLLLLAACNSPVPIKFPEDGRVFSGVWTGKIFETPDEFDPTVGGNRIALVRGKELFVMDATTGQQVSRLENFKGGVLAVSSDGSRVFDSFERELRIRDATNLQTIRTLTLESGSQFDVQISRDGSRFLTRSNTGDNGVAVWDSSNGQLIRRLSVAYGPRPTLSSSGRYMAETLEQGNPVSHRLWRVSDGSSVELPLPVTNQNLNAQLSPLPRPSVWWFAFSPDDSRLAGLYLDGYKNQKRLLVWNLSSLALEANLLLPDGQLGFEQITLSDDGSSGSLFWQSFAGNRIRYQNIPWNLQGLQTAKDLTSLFEPYFRANLATNGIVALISGEAYLFSYLQFSQTNRSPAIVNSTGLARVGTTPWEIKREIPAQDVRFEVQARVINDSSYTITGTATLAGQNYSVSGTGSGNNVRFFGAEAQTTPYDSNLNIQLELTSPTNQKSRLFAEQSVVSATNPPLYLGSYETGGSLRQIELKRP